ncbi:MAG: MASE3 domain-containing protein [Candidatus Omnitrophica bacterium]|nr:MASE3 domain-containing protein [Candidatus Omnitrophota bacterium]MDD5513345.1 MASE3 domain-containing protein [Candidatus Omnitrophota bacterium]
MKVFFRLKEWLYFPQKKSDYAILMFLFGALYLVSLHNYLFFHGLVEIFSVLVAFSIFLFIWNARKFLDNGYFILIGIAYLFVGGLDLLHTFTYQGMGIFPGTSTDVPTQLWISARYLSSGANIAAAFFAGRRIRVIYPLMVFSVLFSLLLSSIFIWGIFPACFVQGQGLTPFKIISEYVIMVLFLGSIWLIWRKRRFFDAVVLRLLITSLILRVLGELCFTLYAHPYGLANLLGHFFKLVAFYLIYKAMLQAGITRPFDILFDGLKRTADHLRQSSERYKAIVEDQTELVCRFLPDGVITFVNKAYCLYFGKDPKELIGRSYMPLIPEEDRGLAAEGLRKISRDNPIVTVEHRVVLPAGQIRWQQWVNHAIFDEKGKIAEFQAVGRDITEKKELEGRLQKRSDELETREAQRTEELLELNEQLMMEAAERMKVERQIRISNAILKLFSRMSTRKEYLDALVKLIRGLCHVQAAGIRVLGKDGVIPYESMVGFSYEFIEKESMLSLSRDQCACIRIIADKAQIQDMPACTSHGSFYTGNIVSFMDALSGAQRQNFRGECLRQGFLSVAVIPIRYEQRIIGAIHLVDKGENRVSKETLRLVEYLTPLIGEGITKFYLRDEIRESNELLEKIFATTHFCIVYLDRNFNFIRVNEAYARACGHDPEFFIGKNHFDLYPNEENRGIFKKVVETGEPFSVYAKPFIFPDHPEWGITYWDWSIAAIKDLSGKVDSLVFCLLDVTDRKQAEQGLAAAQQELSDSKRLSDIGLLAATVAHELRNPLAAIKMAGYNIKRKANNPLLEKHFSNIEIKVTESEQIIDNLLFYSRIKMPSFQSVEILDVLDECIAFAKERFAKYDVSFKTKISNLKDVIIEADALQLKELFGNITNNAFDAMGGKKGSILVESMVEPDKVIIMITDSGSGINPSDLERVFDPFFTTKAKGTGLGLTVCNQIVRLHKGSIRIDSRIGKGTSISVTLPRKALR